MQWEQRKTAAHLQEKWKCYCVILKTGLFCLNLTHGTQIRDYFEVVIEPIKALEN